MSKKQNTSPRQTVTPEQVQEEYREGVRYKSALGTHGMYEQNRINERFYCGDQWHGVNCGDSRPLVRYNVIKRIGDYKMAVVGSEQLSVRFTAEGVPNTLDLQERVRLFRQSMSAGGQEGLSELTAAEEAQVVAGALTDYFRTTGRRLKLDMLKQRVLRNAYLSGTGVLYTYWDDSICTGLYADEARQCAIYGDIAAEVLEIEQLYVGDPTLEDLQQQPYITIAQRRPLTEVRRMAKRHGCTAWDTIPPADGEENHALLLTRFWKEWEPNGESCTVWAMQVCGNTVVRPAWKLGVRLYPLSIFRWDEKRHQAYGESEIPHLIPNQIAINRTISAQVWAVMMMGMPIMLVNGDVVNQPITNDPGQVVPVYGAGDTLQQAIRYVDPPAFSTQFDANVKGLINDTMTQAGVNSTLLGDVQPNNTSAIIAVREASLMPLHMMQNRFYTFIEETARIWSEFWLAMYGDRQLKIEQEQGVWYMPFDSKRYRRMLLGICVDVGAGQAYNEQHVLETLDGLYNHGVINAKQYLSRLPQGTVPQLDALLQELT
ncbi:MAG: hypothetical protein II363_03735 [Clostridia bacterium]|nr:hypothetical protein [Clostridia bacterium]